MGAPNFKRLAELGQLPDYVKLEGLVNKDIEVKLEAIAEKEEVNEVEVKEEIIEDLLEEEENQGEFIDELLK